MHPITLVVNTKICVANQKVIEETSDDCEVEVEGMSLGMVLKMVLSVPGALTQLVVTSGNKAEGITGFT